MKIKRKFLIISLILFLALSIYARDDDELDKVIQQMGLVLTLPDDFIEIPKVDQEIPGTYYDRGYKSKNYDFEVRFFVMPAEDCSDDPVQFYKYFPKTILFNITHNMYYTFNDDYITHFPQDAVQRDFGADFGFTCKITGESDFLKGYKWALVTVVLKKEKGMFFIFQLFNESEIFKDNMELFNSSFYILRFKEN